MRTLGVLLFAVLPALAWAQGPASPQIMTDVNAGNFSAATALAAATGDPLTQKLVTFFRLLDPGGGTADEIGTFIAQNPDWPEQGLLALREQQDAKNSHTRRSSRPWVAGHPPRDYVIFYARRGRQGLRL